MPLLLSSTFQHFEGLDRFLDRLSTWKVSCITTAALAQCGNNLEPWALSEIDNVCSHAKEYFEYDLRGKILDDLKRDLHDCDLVYFTGGNTYCLLEAIQKSGFYEFSKMHLAKEKSIWGSSAGSIVNGPDIQFIASMDEPEKANLESTKEMNYTHLYILPHWNGELHDEALQCLNNNRDLPIICLNDSQAIYIENNRIEIL
jgi:peptidase E